MWTSIVFTLVTSTYNMAFDNKKPVNTELGFEVGDRFADLDSETITYLHQSKHIDVRNTYTISIDDAPNTDDCFTFTDDCQPDRMHHVYYVPMRQHMGYFYVVTFSMNGYVLNIKNTYLR